MKNLRIILLIKKILFEILNYDRSFINSFFLSFILSFIHFTNQMNMRKKK